MTYTNPITYVPAITDGPSTSIDTLARPAQEQDASIERLTTNAPSAATTHQFTDAKPAKIDDSVEKFCKAWLAKNAAQPPVAYPPDAD